MPFNVSRFRGAFSSAKSEYVIAPSNYFEVQFMSLPKVFNDAFNKKENGIQKMLATEAFENMRFRCHHADIPAKMMAPMTRGGFMGPNRQMPHSATFAPVQLDFLESPRFNIRAFLDAWTEICEGYHNGYVNEYYDDIIMPEIRIVMFSRDGKRVAHWTLYDCWPSSTTHSSVSWDSVNSNITVGAEMMYYRWDSFWYSIDKNDCSIDGDDVRPVRRSSTPSVPPDIVTQPEPNKAHIDVPALSKQQILRTEWGEPYILQDEGNKKLSTIDTNRYENVTIDSSTWNKTGVDAPRNKL